ncbi:MAG TPA: alpha-L-arabinofuranosidase C-terminal domain-containing protein [Pyrinomonadaceae bacterium]|jgi:alpha-N-arabinofuranosidase|nr:alpha-L-arabinofuranosidase C-terminal domain-containing protein [Pyrinomonadaceae bacterium]
MNRIQKQVSRWFFLPVCALSLSLQAPSALAQNTNTITVQVDKPGADISPTMFGIFFEDINFGADGGLYPERVKNRSFEFPEPLMAWKQIDKGSANGSITVLTENPINDVNAHYLHFEVTSAGKGFGVMNEGFRGMGFQRGAPYVLTLFARNPVHTERAGNARITEHAPVVLRAELEDQNGRVLATARLSGFSQNWKKHSIVLRPSATSVKAHLNLFVEAGRSLDLDIVSLFPMGTWKNRENGLRADLVQLLKDMKPGFLRFPGGCIVEGRYLKTRYQWKTTVGDLTKRKLIINRWNDEFKHRPAPDYYQSFGLGFFEYFQLAEDIGAEPLPLVNCGMACQFNSSELVPLDQLDPYVQDALDLIEFANGPVSSEWGRLRAAMGHPAPFNMKMLGVGNEQWGPQFIERYEVFSKTLKAKHPEITLISDSGPSPNDERFKFLWTKLRELNADIVDEHYYTAPGWFLANSDRYDNYPRTGPKVFSGEYAAQSVGIASPNNRNNWECALAEAAFITGLERNADVVRMASYAPLFAHVDGWQWTPNLIWFDNLRSYGTPNYYVQKLFSTNRGTNILPVLLDGSPRNAQQSLYASASVDRRAGEVVLKIVNAAPSQRNVRINLAGASGVRRIAKAYVLGATDLKTENSLDQPMTLAPVQRQVQVQSVEFSYTLDPSSVTVLRIATR